MCSVFVFIGGSIQQFLLSVYLNNNISWKKKMTPVLSLNTSKFRLEGDQMGSERLTHLLW